MMWASRTRTEYEKNYGLQEERELNNTLIKQLNWWTKMTLVRTITAASVSSWQWRYINIIIIN